jgi:YggT family protein
VVILCPLLTVFIVILIARALCSWFPIRPGTVMAQINGILVDLTEWALAPMRRVIPAAGMFDLSFLVLVLGLSLLRSSIC